MAIPLRTSPTVAIAKRSIKPAGKRRTHKLIRTAGVLAIAKDSTLVRPFDLRNLRRLDKNFSASPWFLPVVAAYVTGIIIIPCKLLTAPVVAAFKDRALLNLAETVALPQDTGFSFTKPDEETLSKSPRRAEEKIIPLEKRKRGFAEVVLGLDRQQAVTEACRCLRCDLEE